jgi:pyruvate dehydrogenase E2 component (dihydrolipoamide acetyltransferase)
MRILRLPRLGQTMETGIVTVWRQAAGAQFGLGDVLYEVETDKMVSEVEAKQEGVLLRILAPTGTDLKVGTPLAVVAEIGSEVSDGDVEAFLSAQSAGPVDEDAEPDRASRPPGADAARRTSAMEPLFSTDPGPAGRDSVGGLGVPQPSGGTDVRGNEGGAVESARSVSGAQGLDAAPPPDRVVPREPPRAYPNARKIARQLGVDLTSVAGSGRHGYIVVRDVREAAERASRPVTSRPVEQPAAADGRPRREPDQERIPLDEVARATASSMMRSWQEVPQFVQQVTVDATALVQRQKRLKNEGAEVTYTDILVSATASTARALPEVNAAFKGDEIVRYGDVNVSIAVATDRGMMMPVVRNADQLPIEQIAIATKALAARARDGRLGPADTRYGTITVSNLGTLGIDTGTPIINPEQSAIVFMGSLSEQPAVRDGQIVVRPVLNIAIAYDHRVVDGMTGARFTAALKARLEAGS